MMALLKFLLSIYVAMLVAAKLTRPACLGADLSSPKKPGSQNPCGRGEVEFNEFRCSTTDGGKNVQSYWLLSPFKINNLPMKCSRLLIRYIQGYCPISFSEFGVAVSPRRSQILVPNLAVEARIAASDEFRAVCWAGRCYRP